MLYYLDLKDDKLNPRYVYYKIITAETKEDLVALASVYLNKNKLTFWKWIKELFTRPLKTIRFNKHRKEAKAAFKKLKYAWLFQQINQTNEAEVKVADELKISKKGAKQFTTKYMMAKLKTAHFPVINIEEDTEIENKIANALIDKGGYKDNNSRKAEKAKIWRHVYSFFMENDLKKRGALAFAKADLLGAEVKAYEAYNNK